MALYIYIGKDNLPDDKELIVDNENFFEFSGITDCEFSRKVLQEIEHGEFVDTMFFKDRFGAQLYTNCCSTGTKTLFNIYNNVDKVFFGGEMGSNALNLLSLIEDGSVYFDDSRIDDILGAVDLSGVYINGKLCRSYEEAEDLLLWD